MKWVLVAKLIFFMIENLTDNIIFTYPEGNNHFNDHINDEFLLLFPTKNCNNKIASSIISLYTKYNINIFYYLKLDVSFILLDKKSNYVLICRDRLGISPIYYSNNKRKTAVSFQLKSLKSHIENTSLNKTWIYGALTTTDYDNSSCFVNEIKRLPPANYMFVKNGSVTIKKYWELKNKGVNNLNLFDNIERTNELLSDSIKSRITDNMGVELSGGLDSSIVTGYTKKYKSNFYSYSHSIPDKQLGHFYPYKDEREFSNLTLEFNHISQNNRKISCNGIGILSTIINEVDLLNAPIDIPFQAISAQLFNKAKEDNVITIFSGFGGDEGISNSGIYSHIAWLNSFKLLKLINKKSVAVILKTFLRKNSTNNLIISNDFAQDMNHPNKYREYHKLKRFTSLTDFIISKLNDNHIQNRIEGFSQSSFERGINYAYPLLDYKLLEFYISVPDKYKFYKTKKRFIAREATKKYLHKEIYLRSDKTGATVPNVIHRIILQEKDIIEYLHSQKNSAASEFIDFDNMLKTLSLIKRIYNGENIFANIRTFISALSIIAYLDKEKKN